MKYVAVRRRALVSTTWLPVKATVKPHTAAKNR